MSKKGKKSGYKLALVTATINLLIAIIELVSKMID